MLPEKGEWFVYTGTRTGNLNVGVVQNVHSKTGKRYIKLLVCNGFRCIPAYSSALHKSQAVEVVTEEVAKNLAGLIKTIKE